MFISNYIPVNVNRTNCAVYSESKVFPKDKLMNAVAALKGDAVPGVVLEDGVVSFVDDPTTQWTVAEVYLANETLLVAEKNDFSFYMVRDSNGILQLFISKSFKRSRILINAFNMRSVLLTKPQLVNKAASIIDKTYNTAQCANIFNTLRDIENGAAKFLSAVICYRGTDSEILCVNPITTILSETQRMYPTEFIEELRKVMLDHECESELVRYEGGKYIPVENANTYDVMKESFVKDLIATYDRVMSNKSNYIPLNDENFNTRLYYSTNHRYLVNAETFECLIIKNQHTRSYLDYLATKMSISHDQLELVWMLARTE